MRCSGTTAVGFGVIVGAAVIVGWIVTVGIMVEAGIMGVSIGVYDVGIVGEGTSAEGVTCDADEQALNTSRIEKTSIKLGQNLEDLTHCIGMLPHYN